MTKPLIDVLKGKTKASPPLWLMRQAGRYLPEYRELRAKAGGFLSMVYDPMLASEVTLQPIRRFGMDGAIVFSDILVIPQALGQKLWFETGEGPKLDPIRSVECMKRLSRDKFDDCLAPIYETLRQVKSKLIAEGFSHTALIGFSGAPWTLACYMVEGQGSRDFHHTKLWAYSDPVGFASLIDMLVDAIVDYLCAQVAAGAEAVQLFDSWAGVLDHRQFERWVIEPTSRIVDRFHKVHPEIPFIGFPRGAGCLALDYAQNTKVTAMSLDPQIAPERAAKLYQPFLPVQGNLDPVSLLNGGSALQQDAEDILSYLTKAPFIFNLGHGVIKETPVAHVEQLVRMVRDWT